VTSSGTVIVVGSLHFDIIVSSERLPMLGETLPGSAWMSKCGGKGGNQAVEAARHGARTLMVGCVGDDVFGARLRDNLERATVDVTHLVTVPAASGMSVVVSERSGDYAAVIVTGSNQELTEAQIQLAAEEFGPGTILVLQNEIPDVANEVAARLARAHGATVLLNAAPARPLPQGLAGLVDVLVVNAIEAEMLGGGTVSDLDTAAEAARRLARRDAAIIVTAGGDGVAVESTAFCGTCPAHEVALISTHGAGDAFIGALACRLAEGEPLESAVSYANAAAALLVMTPEDARSQLTAADTRKLLGHF
jgi:ribokinase